MRLHSHSRFASSAVRLLLTVCGLWLLTGCGDGKIARYPVTGIVTVDDKPAAEATVIFNPVNGSPEVMKERPFSQTDASGKFELRTLMPGDGAPAGEYKVTIRWPIFPPGGGPVTDRLGNRYWDPAKTTLTAKVEKGTNEIPFKLSSKGK